MAKRVCETTDSNGNTSTTICRDYEPGLVEGIIDATLDAIFAPLDTLLGSGSRK